jgi:pre-mRNA-splicing helicase BRR2
VSPGDLVTLTIFVEREGDEDEDDEEEEERVDQEVDSVVPFVRSRFPKKMKEEWWVVVGDVSQDRLVGIKRLQLPNKGSVKKKMKIQVPMDVEKYNLKMYVISDSYRGCDEERDVEIF